MHAGRYVHSRAAGALDHGGRHPVQRDVGRPMLRPAGQRQPVLGVYVPRLGKCGTGFVDGERKLAGPRADVRGWLPRHRAAQDRTGPIFLAMQDPFLPGLKRIGNIGLADGLRRGEHGGGGDKTG